ncbi:MAG: hypothetical protein AAB897_03820 [Patescibacteria group bacterium]
MPEQPEKNKESDLAPELLEKIRIKFAEELDARAAKSPNWAKLLGPEIGEKIICGEKAPRKSSVETVLLHVAEEFGFKQDTIDKLFGELLG